MCSRQALQAAIGEKLLISKADYFVMSKRSGFARQPAVQVEPKEQGTPQILGVGQCMHYSPEVHHFYCAGTTVDVPFCG